MSVVKRKRARKAAFREYERVFLSDAVKHEKYRGQHGIVRRHILSRDVVLVSLDSGVRATLAELFPKAGKLFEEKPARQPCNCDPHGLGGDCQHTSAREEQFYEELAKREREGGNDPWSSNV